MLKDAPRSALWILAASLVVVACGDDDDSSANATGGTSSHGGASSTGGASAGGAAAKGGASANGGNATATGGATTTSGGATVGGAASGGASLGGRAGATTGGSATVGGAPEGGAAVGGEAGSGSPAGGVGGSTPEGGAGGFDSAGAGGVPIVPDVLDNPGFESGTTHSTLPGWTITGTPNSSYVSYMQANAHGGYGYLDNWLATAYTVTTSQVVSPLPKGNYSFSIWHTGGAYTKQQVFARGYDANDPSAEMVVATAAISTYEQIVISPIPVTSGQVEVGVYSEGADNNWSHFDDAVLTQVP